MRWIVFDSKEMADAFSHLEAIIRGLGKQGDICQYWWIVKPTKDGKWAVQCPQGSAEPEFEESE